MDTRSGFVESVPYEPHEHFWHGTSFNIIYIMRNHMTRYQGQCQPDFNQCTTLLIDQTQPVSIWSMSLDHT